MALASVLRSELPEFSKSFPKPFPKSFPKSFPEDCEGIPEILRDPPGPPRALAAPPWGVQEEPEGPGLEILHGTTTLAFKTPHGVTVAVDSRATAGSYIASQSVRKVLPINPRIIGTMAGGAADCSFWQRLVARQCRVQELRNKEPVSVAAASKLLANLVYQYKGMGLSLGTMVCGWDKRGPALYYVDSEGQRVAGSAFAVGSGSAYAYGVLDRGLASPVASEAAACALARRAIYQAARRDAYSGGAVRVFHVGAAGWREVSEDNVAQLQQRYGE
ncbi:proteasome subunit beta type-5 isoform X2 [Vidua chalybeata]|uniref:proteasome subunit beta type-5 isoform X1 n=1 Tax=Vidua chalybeata TaxID=81927 RepID=UPI0023A7C3D7|nr:proteasome subunit beta type-5 isoform X1 [Vidua chalybeata]XP_053824619.1 proteasome subunit beta type-5 isoform X2 [Vidua chalybeata]